MIKVIKTEQEYEAALAQIERLVGDDPVVGTPEADELELLAALVEQYEDIRFPISLPDPIEAIRFRMEQQGLADRDLVPYLGSRSRVSEILSGKRSLSLSMIRSLNAGLGIPLEVLVQEQGSADQLKLTEDELDIEWSKFPFKEMLKRGWFSVDEGSKIEPKILLQRFFAPIGHPAALVTLNRQTQHTRSGQQNDEYALQAWRARVATLAFGEIPPVVFDPAIVNRDFLRTVARLSVLDNGPLAAKEFLNKQGISVIIEPHLPHTHLDGAAMKLPSSQPIIGLTIRHDRLDNFWFTLMHELAHVVLHLNDNVVFYDDIESDDQGDLKEQEADELAGESLIPSYDWMNSGAQATKSPTAIERLARELNIHRAIIAGRIRHEENNYRMLDQLVGRNEVQRLFREVNWKH